jgi:hypothetical protein
LTRQQVAAAGSVEISYVRVEKRVDRLEWRVERDREVGVDRGCGWSTMDGRLAGPTAAALCSARSVRYQPIPGTLDLERNPGVPRPALAQRHPRRSTVSSTRSGVLGMGPDFREVRQQLLGSSACGLIRDETGRDRRRVSGCAPNRRDRLGTSTPSCRPGWSWSTSAPSRALGCAPDRPDRRRQGGVAHPAAGGPEASARNVCAAESSRSQGLLVS